MSPTPSTLGAFLILALLALILGHAWVQWKSRRWMLLDPLNTFWGGVVVCYIQQPLLGADMFMSWHKDGVFEKALLATLVGLIFVVVGYELRFSSRLVRHVPLLPQRFDSDRLFQAATTVTVIGLIGHYFVISRSGGWSQFISVGRGAVDITQVQGYWPQLVYGVPAGAALLLFWAYLRPHGAITRVLVWTTAGLVWLWFLYLGSRSRVIVMTLVMLAAYYLPKRRNPPVWLSAAVFLALSIIVPFQGQYRWNFTNLSFNLDKLNAAEVKDAVLPGFLGGSKAAKRATLTVGSEFNCVMAVVELVPEQVPFNYGYGHLEIFTRVIPRAIWPGKRYPHLESVQGVMREGGLSQSAIETSSGASLLGGPALTFTGHWFYVAGWLGMVLGGLITGILLRTIRSWYDQAAGNHSALIIYPFLLPIGFMEAASTPWYWVFYQPFVVLPFILVAYFCRENASRPKKTKSRTTPASVEPRPASA